MTGAAAHRILPWATRYALGRDTYAVDDVVKTIVELAPSMSIGEREKLRAEIAKHVGLDFPRVGAWHAALDALEVDRG